MNYLQDDRIQQLENLLITTFDKLPYDVPWTDFTYNGTQFYIHSPQKGRYPLAMSGINVENFIRQVANLMGKNYNLTTPILDLSFGHYRVNAMFSSIARQNNLPCLSFAIRRMSQTLCIVDGDTSVMPPDVRQWIVDQLHQKQSFLISGRTGTGKTELQKYLLSKLNDHTRVIMIEDTYETHLKELAPHLDVTTWIVPPNSPHLMNTYRELLLAALRNNPDWIVMSELRGNEARAVYEAALAGHPMITTMHSSDASFNLHRLAQLINDSPGSKDSETLETLVRLFPFSIHMADEIASHGNRIYTIQSIVQHSYDRRSNRLITKSKYERLKGWLD